MKYSHNNWTNIRGQAIPNWSSLRRHTTPEWLDDLKFGIYCHWGPQTVKLANMDKGLSTKEAIELWKGEKFSAKEWVDLFQAAGAQFGGPIAWHGSGMLNWKSEITDWNTFEKGPGVDIVKELSDELRERGMKVMGSFHSTNIWGPITKDDDIYNEKRSDQMLQGWYERVTEAIDKYELDIVWVDEFFGGTVGPELRGRFVDGRLLDGADNSLSGIREQFQQKLVCHFYNKGIEWGKDVAFIYKSFDIPPGIGMRDIENGSLKGLQYHPWMADINMAHHHVEPLCWFYKKENPMKDANALIDMLVDMTSKNGRMLLSVPPTADGTFSEEARNELLKMGKWLKNNGEAIYGTIPWVFFGEGPNEVIKEGHHAQGINRGEFIARYNEKDIRFTQKDNYLYATCLGWPGKELRIRALGHKGKLYAGDIKSVSMLGTDEEIKWEHNGEALIVQFPKTPPCEFAYCIKIGR